jgi:ankyrin repeat protein
MKETRFNPKISAAIRARNLPAFQALLKAEPEQITAFTPFAGGTWLHYAAYEGDVEAVAYLLSLEVDVNVGDAREGRSPLCDACSGDHPQVVRHLLASGALIDTTEPVRNPLFAAIVASSSASVSLLLDHGMDTTIAYDSPRMKRMDAVAFAMERGEREIAQTIARYDSPANIQHRLDEALRVAALNSGS